MLRPSNAERMEKGEGPPSSLTRGETRIPPLFLSRDVLAYGEGNSGPLAQPPNLTSGKREKEIGHSVWRRLRKEGGPGKGQEAGGTPREKGSSNGIPQERKFHQRCVGKERGEGKSYEGSASSSPTIL